MNDIKMKVTIDDVRTYWDDRPCNVKHSKKKLVRKNTLMK